MDYMSWRNFLHGGDIGFADAAKLAWASPLERAARFRW